MRKIITKNYFLAIEFWTFTVVLGDWGIFFFFFLFIVASNKLSAGDERPTSNLNTTQLVVSR